MVSIISTLWLSVPWARSGYMFTNEFSLVSPVLLPEGKLFLAMESRARH